MNVQNPALHFCKLDIPKSRNERLVESVDAMRFDLSEDGLVLLRISMLYSYVPYLRLYVLTYIVQHKTVNAEYTSIDL